MKLDIKYKPELCVSKDFTRPQLANCHLAVEDNRIVATNGHIIISLPCEASGDDVTGPISSEALVAARKLAKKAKEDSLGIDANGKYVLSDGSTVPRTEAPDFPPYKQVIPSYEEEETVTFGINAELLATLQKAIGADYVKVTVKLPRKREKMLDPILVSDGDGQATGVCMPCRYWK
jgi:DNA polymerase III sliding clamp (beta) subunit (PCNA family)